MSSIDALEDRVAVKRLIGFLPDEPVFYSYLSGREVLELSAAMHGLDVPATMDRIGPIIARLRLADDIDNYAEDYSRGMKKKLGLTHQDLADRATAPRHLAHPIRRPEPTPAGADPAAVGLGLELPCYFLSGES